MDLRKRIGCALGVALALAAGVAAQSTGQIVGEVLDLQGKPFADLPVVIKSDEMGQTFTVKTDKNGRFLQAGLRGGIYTLTFQLAEKSQWQEQVRVPTGGEAKVSVNFKEIMAREGAKDAERRKKEAEESRKFEDMKAHYESGRAAMDQAKGVREEIQRTPAADRNPLQVKLTELYQTAVTEFEEAQKFAPPNEPQLHIVVYNLAHAYERAGRYEEAAAAFQKATELRPAQAEYFLDWGTALARAGKVSEANAACEKALALNPGLGAQCWRNVGIVLHNAGKMAEAVPLFRRATELDPKNAQAWHLLGTALVATMSSKIEGDKVVAILQPGTVEAFQRCIEADPNGPYAPQAKQNLEMLEAMGVGIQTKVKARKK